MIQDDNRMRVVLVPAPGEDATSAEYQQAVFDLALALSQGGVPYEMRSEVRESEGASRFLSGELWMAVAAIGSIAGPIIGAWITGRMGRRVSIERDGIKVEDATLEAAQRAIDEELKRRADSESKVKIQER